MELLQKQNNFLTKFIKETNANKIKINLWYVVVFKQTKLRFDCNEICFFCWEEVFFGTSYFESKIND